MRMEERGGYLREGEASATIFDLIIENEISFKSS
jgi:hypothetical protein